MNDNKITELNLNDASHLYDKLKFADNELVFADDITSIPNLDKVFKVNFIAMVFCVEGSMTVKLNGRPWEINRYDGLFVDQNTVVEPIDHSDDMRCIICGFSADVGINLLNKRMFDAFLEICKHPVVSFSEDEITLMLKYYELGLFKLDHPEITGSTETLKSILRCLTVDLLYSIGQHVVEASEVMMRQSDRIYRRFILMLTDDVPHNRNVKYYADELCVSPKYLSSICRQHSGQTANRLIATAVVARIKQLLLYSDLSIKEIANELNFDNISFFGKYVKKHLGLSPNHYRRANHYGQ